MSTEDLRPRQPFYLRPRATFDRVGPLVAAQTPVRFRAFVTTAVTRGATGKPLLLAEVDVLEGPQKRAHGFAALSLDDLVASAPDSAEAVVRVSQLRAEFDRIVAALTAPAAPPQVHPPAELDGLVIDGRIVPVPGLEILSYLGHPKLVPEVKDGYARDDDPVSLMFHTVHGKAGRVIEAPAPPSSLAERYARYQALTPRDVSWHITGDLDRTWLVSADLRRRACWHAPPTNRWSIGVELVQTDDGTLYGPQLDDAVTIAHFVCDRFAIPKRVPCDAHGRPYTKAVKAWQPRAERGRSERWAGVLEHRNVTTNRGVGDAGDAIMLRLLAAGFAPFDVTPLLG